MIGYRHVSAAAGRMAAWPARVPEQRFGVAGSWFFGEPSGHPEKGVVMHGTIGRRCRYWAIGGLAAVVGLAVLAGPAGPARADSRQDLKNFQHVFVIMMENTGFDSLDREPERSVDQPGGANVRFGDELLRRHASEPAELHRRHLRLDQRRHRRQRRHDQRPEHRRPAGSPREDVEGVHAVVRAVHDAARPRVREPAVRAQAQPVRVLPGCAVEPGADGEHRRSEPVLHRPGRQHRARLRRGSARTSATTCTDVLLRPPIRATSRRSSH